MRVFIILATLIAAPVFADVHLKIEGIEGDATDAAAPVIDNEENAAEDVRVGTITNTGEETSGEINGQIEMLSPNLESKSKAQDYNSSRPNRTGAKAQDHNSTRSNRGRRLDTDDDDDGVLTKEVCNAVDNDCDDADAEGLPTGKRQHKSN